MTGSPPAKVVLPLDGKQIVLGVCGAIAAYKAVELCRQLVDMGAHVVPVLTDNATQFVGETTFSALASERVRTSLWSEDDVIPHTRLGRNADVIVVAPASASTIGKYTAGIASDLLTTTLLATRAPVILCPSMHTEMWEHAAVQENLATLRRRGVVVVEPDVGRLAGGDVGTGRLAEPLDIIAAIERAVGPKTLEGRTVLVTAGGTREPLDPVRYISNRSSGKQGHAMAEEAAARGAETILVTASALPTSREIRRINVSTAREMEAAVLKEAAQCNVIVMAAAVADFQPAIAQSDKLRRTAEPAAIALEPTPDILAELVRRRTTGQIIVGFAAETRDLVDGASAKLASKGVDYIVANEVDADTGGFNSEQNAIVLLGTDGTQQAFPLQDKRGIARSIFEAIAT